MVRPNEGNDGLLSSPTKQPSLPSHRLATQSAASALQNAGRTAVATGLSSLDTAISGGVPTYAGIQRSKVTEIWGPSGSGKTALAFQTSTQVIKEGEAVIWIDTSTELGTSRLHSLRGDHESFLYISVPTLSHLLALLLHPPPTLIPANVGLLVVDDINTLIELEYPRQPFSNLSKTEKQKWQAGRRYAVLGSLVNALNKLAALHNVAVILTTGCSSRMRGDSGLAAALAPGVGGAEWEAGISNRIVMFQDFNGRFLGVQKCQGRNLTPLDPVGDIRTVIGFAMSPTGTLSEHITDLTSSNSAGATNILPQKLTPSPAKKVRKRKFDEIADSDEDADEYGWAEGDDFNIAEIAIADPSAAAGPGTRGTQ